MRPLYEIGKEYFQLLNAIEAEYESPDDVPAEVTRELEAIEGERQQKILNIARIVKNLSAEHEAVKAERVSLQNREKSLSRRVDWLKGYLSHYMDPGESVQDANTRLSWRQSTSVHIPDELLVPDQYCSFERKVSKEELAKDLKNGAKLPFASLIQKYNLQIK